MFSGNDQGVFLSFPTLDFESVSVSFPASFPSRFLETFLPSFPAFINLLKRAAPRGRLAGLVPPGRPADVSSTLSILTEQLQGASFRQASVGSTSD